MTQRARCFAALGMTRLSACPGLRHDTASPVVILSSAKDLAGGERPAAGTAGAAGAAVVAAATPRDRSFAALRMTRIVDDAAGQVLRGAQEDKNLLGVILSNAKDPAGDGCPAAGTAGVAAASPQDRSFAALRMTRIVDDAAGQVLRGARRDRSGSGAVCMASPSPMSS